MPESVRRLTLVGIDGATTGRALIFPGSQDTGRLAKQLLQEILM